MSTTEYILSTMLLVRLSQWQKSISSWLQHVFIYPSVSPVFEAFPHVWRIPHLLQQSPSCTIADNSAICPFFQPPLQLQYGHMTQTSPIHALDFPWTWRSRDLSESMLEKIMAMVAAASDSQRQQASSARAALRSSIRIGRRQCETGTQWCPPGSSSVHEFGHSFEQDSSKSWFYFS